MLTRSRIMISSNSRLLVLVGALASVVTVAVGEKASVYFTLMVSSAPTLNTSGVVHDVDRTLELISNNTAILPSYSMQYSQVLDTQVRAGSKFAN